MAPIVSEQYKMKKKQQILDSALICFANKGYQQATMDDIVQHSGISKGAIYNYFKSKEEIYIELMNENTKIVDEDIKEGIRVHKTALEKVSYLFDLYLRNKPSESPEQEIFLVYYEFRLHATRDEKLFNLLQERKKFIFIENLVDILVEGQKNGELRQDFNPEIMANTFWSMIHGATLSTIIDMDFPYHEVLENMKAMFIPYLKSN
ncbi:TetR/AcrR family transcriptional regulator [Heyndrickxia sp. NPDC080065]|uniref:TetR/AcrR family transcriptional regulator n=1 Tax=Heyndrickxia sp. NPDC080065 TaxID=3390568 RepID=UPI003D00C551